jgi:ribonucleoside-diphosphate reductase alpha chain
MKSEEGQTIAGTMQVQKRNGTFEPVDLNKITARLANLAVGLSDKIDVIKVAINTVGGLYDGISTEEIDMIAARWATGLKLENPLYDRLAGNILISNLQKNTDPSFSRSFASVYPEPQTPAMKFIFDNAEELDKMIIPMRDYDDATYLSAITFINQYALTVERLVHDKRGVPVYINKAGEKVPEDKLGDNRGGYKRFKTRIPADRPQYLKMRVAVQVFHHLPRDEALRAISQHYKYTSLGYMTGATPTLQNSCSPRPQLAACFLYEMPDDREGILNTVTNTAFISALTGGIGISMTKVRNSNALIKSTGSSASGPVSMCRMISGSVLSFNQGGKRNGSCAVYIELHHPDFISFVKQADMTTPALERNENLQIALYVSDLFMKRYTAQEPNAIWSFFNPDETPELQACYDGMLVCKHCGYCENIDYLSVVKLESICGSDTSSHEEHEFEERDMYTEYYTKYERLGYAVSTMRVRDFDKIVWKTIALRGFPYITFKDSCNRMNNQKNVGTIKGLNLCAEIKEWYSADSIASCILASISLPKFVVDGKFDFAKLHEIAEWATVYLNNVLDNNHYPVEECIKNAKSLRPIALGIQGLSNVTGMMRIPFISPEAEKIDLAIAETIYHAAVTASCNLAKTKGPYSMFEGSPASKGILQFDMWSNNRKRLGSDPTIPFSGMYDWEKTKADVMKYGLHNSLLVAFMPTVSTSQLMGNNESFEPPQNAIYNKKTQSGLFQMMDVQLAEHMIDVGLWTEKLRDRIAMNNGTIDGLAEVPQDIQDIHADIFHVKQIALQNRTAKRQAFVDQTQSHNVHLSDDKMNETALRTLFRNGWQQGMITGSYYTRTRTKAKPMETVTSKVLNEPEPVPQCLLDNPECESCSG